MVVTVRFSQEAIPKLESNFWEGLPSSGEQSDLHPPPMIGYGKTLSRRL